MSELTKRVLDCDNDGERGERGERGKRGHRGHRGHDGNDGIDGATGATGPTGPTGSTALAGSSNLFQFSGTIGQSTTLVAPGSNFSDGGFASAAFPDDNPLPTGGPFPAYPLAQPQTISALAVNIFVAVPVALAPPTGTISFQLVTVPDDSSGPETLIGAPVTFAALVAGNTTDRVVFPSVTLDPGVRLALRVFGNDVSFTTDVTILVAATAG